MTENQMELIELIISEMKKSDKYTTIHGPTQSRYPLKTPIPPEEFSGLALTVMKILLNEGYIQKAFSSGNHYLLTEKGRDFKSFREKEVSQSQIHYAKQLELEKLVLEVDELRKKLSDYTTNKLQTKTALYISIGSLAATIALGLLQLFNK